MIPIVVKQILPKNPNRNYTGLARKLNRKGREERKDKTFLHPFASCFGVAQHKFASLRLIIGYT